MSSQRHRYQLSIYWKNFGQTLYSVTPSTNIYNNKLRPSQSTLPCHCKAIHKHLYYPSNHAMLNRYCLILFQRLGRWPNIEPTCVCWLFRIVSAELPCKKHRNQKVFFQFEIIINVLVSSYWFIWIPMVWVYGHYKYLYSYSAGIDFSRQNLTSTFWVSQSFVHK